MMINKRLIGLVPESKKAIAMQVTVQWLAMICNIGLITSSCYLLQELYYRNVTSDALFTLYLPVFIIAIFLRSIFMKLSVRASFQASHIVKKRLRRMIMEKLIKLEGHYMNNSSTAQLVQLSTEGIEQLETYFGSYLPQFFFAMLAPVTLFVIIAPFSFKPALALLICVPLIPISIALVQTFAKKLLSKYWGQYTALGDSFLENLQGLTTLKIYQSDALRHEQMNEEAEKFRKITMKVLTMQLNSITIMDLVAYGGAALGILLALFEYRSGAISIFVCMAIILLSADFFLPMRTLGSYFHIAMNGMAASDKIFKLLDLEEPPMKTIQLDKGEKGIRIDHLTFDYDGKEILHDLSLNIKANTFMAIVGESGSGKSTLANCINGVLKTKEKMIYIQEKDITEIKASSLHQNIVTVSFDSYLFSGTVRDNLVLVNHDSDEKMIEVLKKVRLWDFLCEENGLDTVLQEGGNNLSGGQRQRLSLARALLHDGDIYIFDEATSNIDSESENEIMSLIGEMAHTKTILLITHRLANAVGADQIAVLKDGYLDALGTHEQCLKQSEQYAHLWQTQAALEGTI